MTERPGWAKSPPDLVDAFGRELSTMEGAQRRQMFGYPAAFVNGNLFTSLHQAAWVVRLPEDARTELLAQPEARIFEPMAGRPMKEYVVVPAELIEQPELLRPWLQRSFAYVQSLPPKKK